jgi:broad specificity phosphatase PhoE
MLANAYAPSLRGTGTRVTTRLLLARHGETDWNREGRWQGQKNVPLSNRGREQALTLANRLKSEQLAAVYSSALQRAIATAQEIAIRHKLNVCRDERLNEIDLGEWEGLPHKDIVAKYPQLLQAWERDPFSVQPPNGEGIAQLERRVLAAVREIALAYPGETVCLIGHKMTNGIIRCHYLGLPLNEALRTVPDHAVYEAIEIPHPQWG